MELSKRLQTVASLVTEGASVADIGTDHGYIPIYLVRENIASRVIASDINKGPLERARMHIIGHGLKGQIETRLSDGLENIKPGEVDTVIAAGMGGGLVIHILDRGKQVVDLLSVMILQPQSEMERVRRYLNSHGFFVEEEKMVEEYGKYYPVMRVTHGPQEAYEAYEYIYGKRLLEQKDPVLFQYLQREKRIRESILMQLQARENSPSAREREKEIRKELQDILLALGRYEESRQMEAEDAL